KKASGGSWNFSNNATILRHRRVCGTTFLGYLPIDLSRRESVRRVNSLPRCFCRSFAVLSRLPSALRRTSLIRMLIARQGRVFLLHRRRRRWPAPVKRPGFVPLLHGEGRTLPSSSRDSMHLGLSASVPGTSCNCEFSACVRRMPAAQFGTTVKFSR